MKKSDYIEKYGQEAYDELLKKQRCYSAAYKTKYPDRVKASSKTYKQTHKEKQKEYNKQYRDSHKEELKAYRDSHKENAKAYRDSHKEKLKLYKKNNNSKYIKENYYTIPRLRANALLCAYRQMDKEANMGESTLTIDWIVENIFSGQSCIYCGESDWTKLGCDRVDNNLPHTPENCVCACSNCNRTRKDKPFEEFVKEKTAV